MVQRRRWRSRVSRWVSRPSACVVGGVSVAAAARATRRRDRQGPVQHAWSPTDVAVTHRRDGHVGLQRRRRPTAQRRGRDRPGRGSELAGLRQSAARSPARHGESYTFTKPGTYTFVCQVHAVHDRHGHGQRRAGHADADAVGDRDADRDRHAHRVAHATPRPTVERDPDPVARRSPRRRRSARPALDTTAPAISKLKLKAVAHGAKVSFALSEPATVTIRAQAGARRPCAPPAVGPRRLPLGHDRAGSCAARYTVEIEARDARGNKAAVQRKSVRVTR